VVDVQSPDGDAVTWLTDSAFQILDQNDDASPETLDSHLEATLTSTPNDPATYYLIVRDYGLADAHFTVSLKGPKRDAAWYWCGWLIAAASPS
jgi:hypothetical protein